MELTEIKLTLIKVSDANQLLDFEINNREWFEQFIPPRAEDFYSLEGVTQHIQEFLLEYKCNRLLPLLIRSAESQIIGRLNFTNVDLKKGTAHVGYRVGYDATSKGVATSALAIAIKELASKGIKRLFAYADVNNLASRKVLMSNGFVKVRIVDNYAELQGQPIDCIEFTCLINER
tara:strand:- start:66 stop:593 length:528 start_codon:yes stop_codon:yes gene_type:complete